MKINSNFQDLAESYLFAEVGARVRKFQAENPDAKVIRMDIGDVTRPIVPAVTSAMQKAVEEMGTAVDFHGYGPEQGYAFLREAILENDYKPLHINLQADEIFVSDGAKCDVANLTDIFNEECVVGVPNPVYPVYVDSNIIAGRNIENGRLKFIECDPSNDYKPLVPDEKLDIIYLCSPNNPTGSVMNREDLKRWVEYALKNESLIIFDSAYEAFISEGDMPKSIYEIEGAERVAIEVRSYSKTAGFTGLRCGYTVVPRQLKGKGRNGDNIELRKMWLRRQTTKFNGASYIVQRGAEAIYSPEGKKQVQENINYYQRNASLLASKLREMGYDVTGGENSPYVWFKAPEGLSSWEMFDRLLTKCNLSSTPGSGFGSGGEGCIRLTGFNTYENTIEATRRLSTLKI